MIHQHQGKHCFGDRRSANADAGIVTACGYYLIGLTFDIDRLTGQTNARGRFQRNARDDILTARYTTENSSSIIALETLWCNLVAMLTAFLSYGFETGSDLDTEKLQKAYTVANARIGIGRRDRRWQVELWGTNIFNQNYVQVGFDGPLQALGTPDPGNPKNTYDAFLGAPAMYGATLRFQF